MGRPCDMCKNYEATIVLEQEKYKSLEAQLNQSRQNVKQQQKIVSELEEKMRTIGEKNRKQVSQRLRFNGATVLLMYYSHTLAM